MNITFDPDKDRVNRVKRGISLTAASNLDWSAEPSVCERPTQERQGNMSKRTNKVPLEDIDEVIRADARRRLVRRLALPTAEEDAAITAAALSDPGAQPMTDAELRELRPARRGRPVQNVTKIPTSIRFDALVLDSFKAPGRWLADAN